MMTQTTQTTEERITKLKEVARVASTLVDGEETKRIISDRAYYYVANAEKTPRFMTGDYFDVDHESFLRTKKFLLRLVELLDFPCDTKLWVRIKGLEDHITLAVQNGNLNRYWQWAEFKRKPEGELAECLDSGDVTVAPPDPKGEVVTVLAPVRDSLDDVVGFVELTAHTPDSEALDPAWS